MPRPPSTSVGTMDDLLDHAPCGFVSFGDDGVVARVNSTLLEMLRYERDELLGRHIEQILTVGSRIFYQTHLFPLLRLEGRVEEIFLLLRTKAGEDVGMLVNASRRERDGAVCFDAALIRVHERRKYEDELLRARREAEDANRAKSNFLAVMSHELRTPLNAIAGYVQLLEMGIHGPVTAAQVETLGRIARSQGHLLRLINDVLDLSRIEAGRVEYVIEDVPAADVVAAVLPMVQPQFAQKGIVLVTEVEAGLTLRADREKAQQILINLLGNAVKFTPAGGRVAVEAVRSTDSPANLWIRVSDTGMGIPPDRLDSIFQPFVQMNRNGGAPVEGSGLGLAISRDLSRAMGGDLTVRSEEGAGSVFILTLPTGRGSAA